MPNSSNVNGQFARLPSAVSRLLGATRKASAAAPGEPQRINSNHAAAHASRGGLRMPDMHMTCSVYGDGKAAEFEGVPARAAAGGSAEGWAVLENRVLSHGSSENLMSH